MKSILISKFPKYIPLAGILIFYFFIFSIAANAQESGERWDPPINISGSGEKPASQPFLLADPAGVAHLFYTQRVIREIGENDTLMYAAWDGRNWSKPVDIFISPENAITDSITYPQAVIDENGIIHLVWMGAPRYPNYSLFYSSVPATEVGSAQSWSAPIEIADDLTGTNSSIALAYEAPQTLHAVFARVRQGDTPPEQRATSYTRSTDGGNTWSDPIDFYRIPELSNGASNIRIITAEPQNVYVTWSEWDETGNGQEVYFVRSLDSGNTWEDPIILAKRKENEYERDWANLVSLGNNKLAVLWEGGFRAYRHAMYSDDGGETWSTPIDAFPGLIGENGYAEFAYDGNGDLHMFVAQRIREGNPENLIGDLGLWHSVWNEQTNWSRPSLAGGPNPMVNPTVAIINGNQVVASWFSFSTFEVSVLTGELLGVPPIQPQPWPSPTLEPAITLTPADDHIQLTQSPEPSSLPSEISSPPPAGLMLTPSSAAFWGLVPAFLIIAFAIVLIRWRKKRSV